VELPASAPGASANEFVEHTGAIVKNGFVTGITLTVDGGGVLT